MKTSRAFLLLCAVAALSGCVSRVDGAAVPEPTKLDCDLIFPPAVNVSP